MIKLRILRWGDYSGLTGCVLSIITGFLQVKEGDRKVREGDAMMEAKFTVMQLLAGGHEQRKAYGL